MGRIEKITAWILDKAKENNLLCDIVYYDDVNDILLVRVCGNYQDYREFKNAINKIFRIVWEKFVNEWTYVKICLR